MLPNHAKAGSIAGSMIDLALKTIAEGIDTEEQRRMPVDLGCDLVQDHRFARPMDEASFVHRCREREPMLAD